MLQFVLGRAGSGKTERLRRMLAEQSLSGKDRLFMLVPEQYSFETEKAMLRLCGAKRANQIQVYSFTRLAEAVFRREGGAVGNYLSDGGRRILMSSALLACEDQLEVYRDAAKSGRVTDLMLTAVNEMKLCGISPEQLRGTADRLAGRGLGKKLSEIALLYGAFEALVEASYLDSRDDLTRLAQCLETSDFFAGATVAVDSFEGFTVQETRVLTQILRRAEKVCVALCTDGLDRGENGLFALVDRTRARLTRAAGEAGVSLLPPVELTGAPRFANENLRLLEAGLFSGERGLCGEDNEGVEIFEARDSWEEAEFVAASIRRLVEEKGWRYRDFSVICRSPERWYGSLDVALEKRGIPCFLSQPGRVDAKPVPRFVLGAFEALRSGLATEDLLKMLKTGVSGFSAEEISALENYAFLWRVERGDWRQDFTRHPEGFGREFSEEDRAALDRLNRLRRRLIDPLLAFAAATGDATGAQISEAVYRLLTDFGLEESLPAYCAALEEAGEEGLSAKQVRVWELLIGILEQMHTILGDRKCPRERYYQLLREVISREDVSEIPQTTDQVLFGTAEQVRQSSPKAAFLIGCAQGEFPLAPVSSGVFSDAERKELIALDLPLGDPLEQKTMEERYLAYSVACAPSELLVLSWSRGSGGEEKEPSELIAGARAVFPTLEPKRDLPDEFFANSEEAAFSRMAARYREDDPGAAALRALFEGREEYRGRLAALDRAAGQRPQTLTEPGLAETLFGRDPFLSPSQIESYHHCAFQYFCRYGLNARERRPAEVDVLQYGTLMHFLFERMFRPERPPVPELSDAALEESVWELIREYARENMGGYESLSGREQYRLGRMAQSARVLLRHVAKELEQSRFVPAVFEGRLGADLPPLRVPDGMGRTVTVGGTIDRADVFTDEKGQRCVRVIDYKTGHKVFRLADVLYGLNMQMLVYLAALTEHGAMRPAGVLYMPAAEPSVSAERGEREEAVRARAERDLKMNGLVLEDSEIIQAMEAGAKGRFIPASLNKDGTLAARSATLSEGDLRLVMEHVKRLIATMGRALRRGEIAARPNLKNENSCRYCPYGPVCGREYTDRDVEKEHSTTAQAMAFIREEGGDGNGRA